MRIPVSRQALILLLIAATLPSSAWAQSRIYKCGKVISEQPCADTPASVLPAPRSVPAEAQDAVANGGAEVCKRALMDYDQRPDKSSLVFEAISRGKTQVIPWANGKIAATTFIAKMNARNSFGAMEGSRTFVCYMNGAESKVLRIDD